MIAIAIDKPTLAAATTAVSEQLGAIVGKPSRVARKELLEFITDFPDKEVALACRSEVKNAFSSKAILSGASKLFAIVCTNGEDGSISLIVEVSLPLDAEKIARATLELDCFAKKFGGSRVTWGLVEPEITNDKVH